MPGSFFLALVAIMPAFAGIFGVKAEFAQFFGGDVYKRQELDAVIVANNIARQVEGKIAYRRAIKMAIANTMRMGACLLYTS